jgi:hypothetical protein
MSKLTILVAFGTGYVLGARAGRERYNQIADKVQQVWQDPRDQRKASQAQDVAAEKASQAAGVAAEKASQAASAVGEKAAQAATSVHESVKDKFSGDGDDSSGASGVGPDVAMTTPPPPTR